MTTAPIYPQADPWTVDDLDRLPDGSFYEIIDGSLLVSPPAGIPHFWRVEIQGDRSPYVVRYGLDGDRYAELGTVFAGDEETVDAGFPVTLRPAALARR